MNKKDLIRTRTANKAKLEPSSWKNKNRIEIDIGNSIEHELAKCICFILLRNGVIPEVCKQKIEHLIQTDEDISFYQLEKTIEEYGQKYKKEWQRPVIVSEARLKPKVILTNVYDTKEEVLSNPYPLNEKKIQRRADLFVLDTGEIVEIETNKKVKKNGAITVYI